MASQVYHAEKVSESSWKFSLGMVQFVGGDDIAKNEKHWILNIWMHKQGIFLAVSLTNTKNLRKRANNATILSQQPITFDKIIVMQISLDFHITWLVNLVLCLVVCFRETSAILKFLFASFNENSGVYYFSGMNPFFLRSFLVCLIVATVSILYFFYANTAFSTPCIARWFLAVYES